MSVHRSVYIRRKGRRVMKRRRRMPVEKDHPERGGERGTEEIAEAVGL